MLLSLMSSLSRDKEALSLLHENGLDAVQIEEAITRL